MTDEATGGPAGFGYDKEIADLLVVAPPRSVVVAPRRWMEPYFRMEEYELRARLGAARRLREPCALWLQALALFSEAFIGRFAWPAGASGADQAAMVPRSDLVALAAGSSKPELDALLGGHYWSAFGMTRSLLEAVRYRRLTVRFEGRACTHLAFLLGCPLICLRRLE